MFSRKGFITKVLFLCSVYIILLFNVFINPKSVHADITTGLVGYWNFDEGSGTTASDSSGNSNTGTLTNGPTWTTGKVGSGAILLDGVDDFVNAGSATSLDDIQSQGGGGLSVSAWVNPTNVGGVIASKCLGVSFS